MIRHCSLLITPLADITFNSFYYIFALKILTKMKIFFVSSLYAVCCILSICMPVNLVSSGVGLKGNWPTVQCTIQQYRLEKNGQLRMQYGPVFFPMPTCKCDTQCIIFIVAQPRGLSNFDAHWGKFTCNFGHQEFPISAFWLPHLPKILFYILEKYSGL